MIRNLFGLLGLAITVIAATGLQAAAVTYAVFDKENDRYDQRTIYGDIEAWDYKDGVTVKYNDGGAVKSQKIERKFVLGATLSDGLDYQDVPSLQDAVEANTVDAYKKVASDAKAKRFHKDFAAWQVANLEGLDSKKAVKALQDYVNTYPNGNFVREALVRLTDWAGGEAKVAAAKKVIELGDEGAKAIGSLQLGKYYFSANKSADAKAAFEAALQSAKSALYASEFVQAHSYLGRLGAGQAARDHFDTSLSTKSRVWVDLRGYEMARGYAFMGRARLSEAANAHAEAYKDFIDASFWLGTYGSVEGECILGAYKAADALSADKKWEARRDTLKSVLEESYPALIKK